MPVSVVFEVNHKENDVYFTNLALFSCCRIMFAVHFCVVLCVVLSFERTVRPKLKYISYVGK